MHKSKYQSTIILNNTCIYFIYTFAKYSTIIYNTAYYNYRVGIPYYTVLYIIIYALNTNVHAFNHAIKYYVMSLHFEQLQIVYHDCILYHFHFHILKYDLESTINHLMLIYQMHHRCLNYHHFH